MERKRVMVRKTKLCWRRVKGKEEGRREDI